MAAGLIAITCGGAADLALAQGNDVARLEEEANNAYGEGNFKRAVELFRKSLDFTNDPGQRAQIYVKIAWISYSSGDSAAVERDLRSALRSDPQFAPDPDVYNPDFLAIFRRLKDGSGTTTPAGNGGDSGSSDAAVNALEQSARRKDESGDRSGAIADLRAALRIRNLPRLHMRIASILEKDGRVAEALEEYKAASQTGGSASAGPGGSGISDMSSGWGDTASQERRDANDLVLKGMELQNRGDSQGAEAAFRRAIEIDPTYTEARLNLGMVFYEQNKLDAAATELERVVATDPVNEKALNNLGLAYHGKGMYDKAIDSFRRAIAINPANEKAYNNLGLSYREKKDLDSAFGAYTKAVEINSQNEKAHNNLGLVLYEQGNFDRAIESFQAALRLRPDYLSAQSNLGLTFLRKRDWPQARQAYEQVIAKDPRNANAYEMLSIISRGQGDAKAAVESGLKATEFDSKSVQAWNNLGLAYKAAGDHSRAIEAFRQAIQINPSMAAIYNNLGSVYFDRRNFTDAVNNFKKAVDLDPSLAQAKINLETAQKSLSAQPVQ